MSGARLTYESPDGSVQTSTVTMAGAIATDGVAGESFSLTIPAGAVLLIDHQARLVGGTGVFGSPSFAIYLDAGETEFAPTSPQFLLADSTYAGWMAIWGSTSSTSTIYIYATDSSFQNGGVDTVQYALDVRWRALV